MAQAEGRRREGIMRHRLRQLGTQAGEDRRRARLGPNVRTPRLLQGVDQHRQPQLPILSALPRGRLLAHLPLSPACQGYPAVRRSKTHFIVNRLCELPHRAFVPAALRQIAVGNSLAAFDPMDDIHTDYLLIAAGIGAAVLALVYLFLT